MGQATNLYSRATPTTPATIPTPDSEAASIVLLYTDSILRYSHLLFCLWSAKGWNPLSLSMMLTTGLPPTFSPDRPSPSTLFRMSSITSITRSQIANTVSQAHGPFLLHLQPPDQIRIFSSIASLYSCLGFKRKEALVLREVQAAIMDLVVCARDESRGGFGKPTTPNSGYFDNDSPYGATGAVGIREAESAQGNSSVVKIARQISTTYGVDITRVRLMDDTRRQGSLCCTTVHQRPHKWQKRLNLKRLTWKGFGDCHRLTNHTHLQFRPSEARFQLSVCAR